jgi:hypothetical protein
MCTECWWGNLNGRGHLEDLGVEGTVLKWILKKREELEWVYLALDGDK